jgi:osmotically-inducible protein OsmY
MFHAKSRIGSSVPVLDQLFLDAAVSLPAAASRMQSVPADHLPTVRATATQAADPVVDKAIRGRVEAALHSDPYFYDAHVTVSICKGDVPLDGFVSSDWDLLDAMRIARKAAGNRRVVDNLSIELGGRN